MTCPAQVCPGVIVRYNSRLTGFVNMTYDKCMGAFLVKFL